MTTQDKGRERLTGFGHAFLLPPFLFAPPQLEPRLGRQVVALSRDRPLWLFGQPFLLLLLLLRSGSCGRCCCVCRLCGGRSCFFAFFFLVRRRGGGHGRVLTICCRLLRRRFCLDVGFVVLLRLHRCHAAILLDSAVAVCFLGRLLSSNLFEYFADEDGFRSALAREGFEREVGVAAWRFQVWERRTRGKELEEVGR